MARPAGTETSACSGSSSSKCDRRSRDKATSDAVRGRARRAVTNAQGATVELSRVTTWCAGAGGRRSSSSLAPVGKSTSEASRRERSTRSEDGSRRRAAPPCEYAVGSLGSARTFTAEDIGRSSSRARDSIALHRTRSYPRRRRTTPRRADRLLNRRAFESASSRARAPPRYGQSFSRAARSRRLTPPTIGSARRRDELLRNIATILNTHTRVMMLVPARRRRVRILMRHRDRRAKTSPSAAQYIRDANCARHVSASFGVVEANEKESLAA